MGGLQMSIGKKPEKEDCIYKEFWTQAMTTIF
jgi:hypothetical protein